MKKIPQLLCVVMIFISLFSACSVEKRRYTSGYNIQWKNSKPGAGKNESAQKDKAASSEKTISAEPLIPDNVKYDETITASADNSPVIRNNVTEKTNNHVDISPEECDIITLKNGDEIKAKVSDITQDEIKYKKCDDLNGPTFTLKKSEVFMIKYPNGTKDVIAQDAPPKAKSKSAEKEDSGIFGILSLSSVILTFIFAAIGGAFLMILLLPAAIVFGAIGVGRKRKARGLAMAGLILGIALLLLTLILIIALASLSFS